MSTNIHLLTNKSQVPAALLIWMGTAAGNEVSVDIPSLPRTATRSKVRMVKLQPAKI